jgi:multidrug resistance efflux pump
LARLDSRPLGARKRAADARAALASEVFVRAGKNLSLVQQLYDDLATSGEELEKAQAELARAKADHEVALARADLAAWRLERTTLKAPAKGTVTQVPGYRGLVVHPRAGNYPVVLFQVFE